MSKINEVFELLRQGKTTFEIMAQLRMTPSRLEAVLSSRRMHRLETLHREAAKMAAQAVAAETALAIPQKLAALAGDDSPRAVKACEALLKQLNLNYPPMARRMMRKSFFD